MSGGYYLRQLFFGLLIALVLLFVLGRGLVGLFSR